MPPKVSVIIPVYKAEKYIEKCVRSLFEQTLDSIEYIFVDDCSPDNSIQIMQNVLEEYPHRKPQVKVIRHETNKGVGQTRQDGIDAATGEYIIHCDPDDWVDVEYYENLYTIGSKNDTEIILGNYIEESDNRAEIKNVNFNFSKTELFHQISLQNLHMALWNKLVRADVAKRFRIPVGVNLWEDLSIMIPILMTSDKIAFSNNGLYHYRIDNPNSIVHHYTKENSLSQIKAIENVEHILHSHNILEILDPKDILRLKWWSKRFLVNTPTKENCDLWRNTFSECNKQSLTLGLDIKSKLISLLLYIQLDYLVRVTLRLNNLLKR